MSAFFAPVIANFCIQACTFFERLATRFDNQIVELIKLPFVHRTKWLPIEHIVPFLSVLYGDASTEEERTAAFSAFLTSGQFVLGEDYTVDNQNRVSEVFANSWWNKTVGDQQSILGQLFKDNRLSRTVYLCTGLTRIMCTEKPIKTAGNYQSYRMSIQFQGSMNEMSLTIDATPIAATTEFNHQEFCRKLAEERLQILDGLRLLAPNLESFNIRFHDLDEVLQPIPNMFRRRDSTGFRYHFGKLDLKFVFVHTVMSRFNDNWHVLQADERTDKLFAITPDGVSHEVEFTEDYQDIPGVQWRWERRDPMYYWDGTESPDVPKVYNLPCKADGELSYEDIFPVEAKFSGETATVSQVIDATRGTIDEGELMPESEFYCRSVGIPQGDIIDDNYMVGCDILPDVGLTLEKLVFDEEFTLVAYLCPIEYKALFKEMQNL